MSFRYHIDPKAGLVFVDAEGATLQAERVATIHAWMSDPNYRPGHDMLCDFSKSTSVPSLQELQEIVGLFMRLPGDPVKRKLAVVATQTVSVGAARQFQGILNDDKLEMKVFPDRPAALSWLQQA